MPFRKNPAETRNMFGDPDLAAETDEHFLVFHIDGGARGNPGPAGYGVLVQDESGKKLDELSVFLGAQTNNFAEYSGLVAALEYALEHNVRAAKVYSDSELLVKQIKGEYKVKSPALLDIYREAKDLIRKLNSFQIRHVIREQNREADRLANLAMDKGMGRAPTAQTSPSDLKEVTGIVTKGVVHLLDGTLPEGAKVVVRLKR